MDRYIKIDDMVELINKEEQEIKQECEEGNITKSHKIMCLGTLEILKGDLLKGAK